MSEEEVGSSNDEKREEEKIISSNGQRRGEESIQGGGGGGDREIHTSMVEAPDDWRVSERIEKQASVVAWNPSAGHFFKKTMQGNEEFDFLDPGNVHHAHYQRRVKVLRLYALHR